jgi:hypothetical protein
MLPLSLSVAACGSYWDLREGESLDVDCEGKLNYYVDTDGDGWGEPSSTPEPLCQPDADNLLTASNNRDCDDSLGGITARIAECPAAIATDEGDLFGLVRGGSEYLALEHPDGWRYSSGPSTCHRWSGSLTVEAEQTEGGAAPDKGLAQLRDAGELADVLEALEEAGWVDAELFVGIRWDSSAETWVWENGDALAGGTLPFCDNREIEPIDFYPNLERGVVDDDGNAVVDAAARLALRREADGSDWCWGLPGDDDAIDDSREYAGVLCERPVPDTAAYRDVPESGGAPANGNEGG